MAEGSFKWFGDSASFDKNQHQIKNGISGAPIKNQIASSNTPGDFSNPPNTSTIDGEWLGWLLTLFDMEIPSENLGTFTYEDGFGFPYDIPIIFGGAEVDSEMLGLLLSLWGNNSQDSYQSILESIGFLQPPDFSQNGLAWALGPFADYNDLVIQYMEHDNPFIDSPAWVCMDANPPSSTYGAVWAGSYWDINGKFGG